jgi:glucose/arabinose dehydrogenase
MTKKFILLSSAVLLLSLPTSSRAVEVRAVRVASGLDLPLFVTAPPGDRQRLFILEQVTARIKSLRGSEVLSTPFLDLGPRVGNGGGEQGLLGLAFHPGYAQNGFFYVNYTDNDGNTVVARYQVSSDPDAAIFESEQILLRVDQPYSNHNGGMLAFGPDGYLYLGLGDGGSANDPGNRAQDGGTLLGKLLRIDVNGGSPYAVPPDNPFVNEPAVRDEIWALGLRNPWRFSFDRQTGDLFIGDVGQNAWEEIDFQPAGSPGGQNYGWRVWEGNHRTGRDGLSGVVPEVTAPIHEYNHEGGRCSVTGGYVYRGDSIPELRGTYFFADFCSGEIWSFRWDGMQMTEFQDRSAELDPGEGLDLGNISSFGEDGAGELYITDLYGGEVFKIVDPFLGLEPGNDPALPRGMDLRVRPNPFNPSTVISYELRAASRVSLRVYDTAGRLVKELVNGWRAAGSHEVTFDGSDLPSGVYLLRVETSGLKTAPTPGGAEGGSIGAGTASLTTQSLHPYSLEYGNPRRHGG